MDFIRMEKLACRQKEQILIEQLHEGNREDMVDVWRYDCKIWILKRGERKRRCFISEQCLVEAIILCRFSCHY